MKKIKIEIAPADRSARGFVEAWRRASRMRVAGPTEERLVFEDLETLLHVLTPKRWALLKCLKRKGPRSVRSLAKILGRDYKNVHLDVKALNRLGLVSRTEQREVMVPWGAVVAEMRLAA